MSNTEREQIKIAGFLQEILGRNYEVRYDDCDSGFTRVYFKPLNIMTAEVPNDHIKAGINTSEFEAKREDVYKALALNLLK